MEPSETTDMAVNFRRLDRFSLLNMLNIISTISLLSPPCDVRRFTKNGLDNLTHQFSCFRSTIAPPK